jgi:hypothetical protein
LRLLIDLHEFGRRARQRGLLVAPRDRSAKGKAPDTDQPPADAPIVGDRGTRMFASDEEGADGVSTDASRALFDYLDR